jgi:hypothetical protein
MAKKKKDKKAFREIQQAKKYAPSLRFLRSLGAKGQTGAHNQNGQS